jgi:hypothetical protein
MSSYDPKLDGIYFYAVYPKINGDLDVNNKVDIYDYNQFIFNLGKTGNPGWDTTDINEDGKVDIFDYNILVGNFGLGGG